jgi:hypothetical protein
LRREQRPITGARYSQSALVRTYFTPVTHLRLGTRAANFQSSLFCESRSSVQMQASFGKPSSCVQPGRLCA